RGVGQRERVRLRKRAGAGLRPWLVRSGTRRGGPGDVDVEGAFGPLGREKLDFRVLVAGQLCLDGFIIVSERDVVDARAEERDRAIDRSRVDRHTAACSDIPGDDLITGAELLN